MLFPFFVQNNVNNVDITSPQTRYRGTTLPSPRPTQELKAADCSKRARKENGCFVVSIRPVHN